MKTSLAAEKHFEPGDHIRMTSLHRNPFEKGYVPKWTRELFVVRGCVSTAPPTYELRRDGRAYKRQVLLAGTAEHFSAQKLSDREDYLFATQKRLKSQALHSLVGLSEKIR